MATSALACPPVVKVLTGKMSPIRVRVDADFSDSWIEDSWINLTLADGTYASFPASTEGGGDRKMFAALEKHIGPPDP